MAKKRSQEMSPFSPELPKQKRMRTTDSNLIQGIDHDDGWTKVERRKQKKTNKAEVRVDVCVSFLSCSSPA